MIYFVKIASKQYMFFVIPAKAGIHETKKNENNFEEIKHNVPQNSETIRSTFFVIVIKEK